MRLVLSADLSSILLNEGYIDELSSTAEIERLTHGGGVVSQRGAIKATTNRGIRLGMTQGAVRGVLGSPKKSFWSTKFKAQELVYRRETKKNKEGISSRFTNYYLFRGGRLYYIELSYDMIGGA